MQRIWATTYLILFVCLFEAVFFDQFERGSRLVRRFFYLIYDKPNAHLNAVQTIFLNFA